MKLKPIIEELRNYCPAFAGRVYGSAQYAQIEESIAFDLPAAFVLPISESPDALDLQNRYMQDVQFNFSVVVLVSTAPQEQGLDAWEQFVDLKDEVFAALLGFDSSDKCDWIEYDGLTIQTLNRAYLAVQLSFKCWYMIEESETRHGGDIERLGRFLRMFGDVDVQPTDRQIEAKFNVTFDNGD